MKGQRRLMGTVLLSLCAVITACAPSPTPVRTDAAVLTESRSADAVNRLGNALADARAARLNVLAPENFRKAENAFRDARNGLENGDRADRIDRKVLASRAYLKKAEASAEIARTVLADALEAREMARSAGATAFEKAYRRVEDDFLDLTRAIERDNLPAAERGREAVIADYRQLEIRAIEEATIGDVRSLIAGAAAAGAEDRCPRTYREATEQLAATEAFISANPHATEKMQAMAAEARFQANRLVAITDASNRLETMDPEAIALLMESHLHAIASHLGAQDLRNHDAQTQLANILGAVDALKNDRDFLSQKTQRLLTELDALKRDYQARIDALNVRVAALEGQSLEDQMAKERMARERMAAEQRLAAEMKFNQLYAAVQQYFESDEAEVYKQENQLVIRLKAMRFPVGKSVILPDNYALLSKVQKAIRTFDDPRVIVEGHTDATGSVEGNMLLSQQRADAVREYLIANQTLPPDSISAVGYGSDRPLASNATAAGRAINRRIDIVILPQTNAI